MALQSGEKGDLVFRHPIKTWDEGLPLGNGRMGCLIWGDSAELRFSLDRTDLWDGTPQREMSDANFNFARMKQLKEEGRHEELLEMFSRPYHKTTPTKLPAGKLIFRLPDSEKYLFSLSLTHAQAFIEIGEVKISTFTAAHRYVGMIRIEAPEDAFSFELANPDFGLDTDADEGANGNAGISAGSLKQLKYPAPEKVTEPGLRRFIQPVSDGFAYGITVATKKRGTVTELAYTVSCSHDGENWAEEADKLVKDALNEGYERMLEGHLAWWQSYMNRSGIDLPDEMMQKNWFLTQYLLASCSRKGSAPMPLQGVWTADDGCLPPWKGDYHHDTNTQMSYYSYLKANHAEEGESFLDYLWERVPAARKFAREFYSADGICMPGTTDYDGKPLGGWPQYSYLPSTQLWLCQSFERHFRYTGDLNFLKERAYPYLKMSAEFLLDVLRRDENGKLFLPLSASPEIHNDSPAAWVTPNSNYDLALMRWLFISLTRMSGILGNGEENRWLDALADLPQLAVDDRSVLMISPDESLTESHRHFAHLMSIHPLRLLDYEKPEDKKIIDASVHDLVVLGTGQWVGFSFAWMAELNAVQGNGEGAAWMLKTFWDGVCLPNGFNANGDYKNRGFSMFHYRPFTLEANFCAADALQEMLLYSENGDIRVFPAVPSDWLEKGCGFHGFRAENAVTVSARAQDGETRYVELTPEYDCEVSFLSPWGRLSASGGTALPHPARKGYYTVKLTAGQTCVLKKE